VLEILHTGVSGLGIQLTERQLEQFERYYQELLDWNRRTNLTTIVEYREVQTKHFLDSLSVALAVPTALLSRASLVDVGAGAGFPGIPLKIAFPGMHLVLVESVAKKAAFLHHLVEVLGLGGVEVYTARAEELAHRSGLRERFDLATGRGVAEMAALAELTLPFCHLGGLVVAHKKGDVAQELARASRALETLGGRLKRVVPVALEGLEDGRVLVVVEKVAPTPPGFPRRPGMPQKRPLG